MKKLFLIDASNMFFRAFYAIRALTNSKGMPTNALYGYLSMTVKLLREMKPDYMAYCFDSKEPGFRDELYTEYKANRSEMPEELVAQMPYFTQVAEKLGIPIFHQEGVEADDIIGTLACFGRDNKLDVTIISSDKDFAQLVGPSVKMYDTMKDVTYDVDGVKEKWGIKPEQMIDYLAMIGDASDNIPGIPGVGPKTAQKLLDQYKSLDDIYEKVETVKPDKLREKIITNKELVYLSKQLVTIVTDMKLDVTVESLKPKPVNREDMVALLNELEFKTFERKIFGSSSTSSEPALNEETKKETKEEVAVAATVEVKVPKKSSIGDVHFTEMPVNATELAQLLPPNSVLWALPNNRGLFVADNKNVYILQDDLVKFSKLFNEKKIQWKGFDLKSFWRSLKLDTPRAIWDHQVASYVVYPKPVGDFSEVYEENFHMKVPDFPSPSEFFKFHLELEEILKEKLVTQKSLEVYEKFDLPLIPVLYSMEKEGILIDTKLLHEQSEGLHKDIRKLELAIYEQAGETFNIASPKQLARILFEKLKLEPMRKTKTGLSTDSDVLAKLDHPVAQMVSDYRELAKLKSTYVDSLPTLVDVDDKRIHTVFNQTITSTGRLSSYNPNIQNIPIRTERGNAIRKAFIAAKGCNLISADYSQIELRVMAHVTEDPALVKAFENDLDIHAATASEVFNVKLKDVTSDQRRFAKAVNFGLAYGMGPHGLAENLSITRSEATEIIGRYFAKFSRVKNYMNDVVEVAKKQGFVETVFGRRRYAPELLSKNANIRNFGERAVINAPMQGTASDIVKKAMIDIFEQTPKVMPESKMLLQVHDELIFEVPKDATKAYEKEICRIMETVVKLKVPLKVNVSSGPSWFDAH